jgi:hypothetical protein
MDEVLQAKQKETKAAQASIRQLRLNLQKHEHMRKSGM